MLKKTNSNNSSDSLKHFSLNGNSEEYNDLTGETITFIENFLKNILEKKTLLIGEGVRIIMANTSQLWW